MKDSVRHVSKLRLKKLAHRKSWSQVDESNISYKNLDFLKEFVTFNGSIKSRKVNTQKKHRKIVKAIKLARYIGLMPFRKKQ